MEAKKFWSLLVKHPNGCWIWSRALVDGYGYLKIGGRSGVMWRAHRYAYVLAKGPIPDGLFVCHSCDTRACCNPDHLWAGTLQQNNADRVAKGRSIVPGIGGEMHYKAIFSDAQREAMRTEAAAGSSYAEIAVRYGTSRQVARQICLRPKRLPPNKRSKVLGRPRVSW